MDLLGDHQLRDHQLAGHVDQIVEARDADLDLVVGRRVCSRTARRGLLRLGLVLENDIELLVVRLRLHRTDRHGGRPAFRGRLQRLQQRRELVLPGDRRARFHGFLQARKHPLEHVHRRKRRIAVLARQDQLAFARQVQQVLCRVSQRPDVGEIQEAGHPFDGVEPAEDLVDQLLVVRVVLQFEKGRFGGLDVFGGLGDEVHHQRRIVRGDRHRLRSGRSLGGDGRFRRGRRWALRRRLSRHRGRRRRRFAGT